MAWQCDLTVLFYDWECDVTGVFGETWDLARTDSKIERMNPSRAFSRY